MLKLRNLLLPLFSVFILSMLIGCPASKPLPTNNSNDEGDDVNDLISQIVEDEDELGELLSIPSSSLPGPDLIVSNARLKNSVSFQTEGFAESSCTAKEGKFASGVYRTVRFDVATINIGNQDLYIGDPKTQTDLNHDGDPRDGLFEWAECHQHFHYRRYATYELVEGSSGQSEPIIARKQGFCMSDNFKLSVSGLRQFISCDNQGISQKWGDIYGASLSGQFFLLNDVSDPIKPETYKIRITVNPEYTPEANEVCPVAIGNGLCRMFVESDYSNNVAEVELTISAEDLSLYSPPTFLTPCSSCEIIPGAFNQKDQVNFYPSAEGFSTRPQPSLVQAWLRGPVKTNFDLFLEQKRPDGNWFTIASSEGNFSKADIEYQTSGSQTLRWRITTKKGLGNYNLYVSF
jgi:Lysyl oxidase